VRITPLMIVPHSESSGFFIFLLPLIRAGTRGHFVSKAESLQGELPGPSPLYEARLTGRENMQLSGLLVDSGAGAAVGEPDSDILAD
jgi:hypothetical protein